LGIADLLKTQVLAVFARLWAAAEGVRPSHRLSHVHALFASRVVVQQNAAGSA
jgi:hypothetical protein